MQNVYNEWRACDLLTIVSPVNIIIYLRFNWIVCCEQANNQIKYVTKTFLYCVIIIYYVINDLMKIRRYVCVV